MLADATSALAQDNARKRPDVLANKAPQCRPSCRDRIIASEEVTAQSHSVSGYVDPTSRGYARGKSLGLGP